MSKSNIPNNKTNNDNDAMTGASFYILIVLISISFIGILGYLVYSII